MNTSAQNGAAIIMVLLIVALATSLAAYMAQQQSLWQRQVESQFDRAQARRIGTAGIDWARAILADDARSSAIDHEKETWMLRLPAVPVENGEVIGMIEDQQGLFNLNNLVRNGTTNAADVAQFQRLLNLLGLPEEMAINLADWMDIKLDEQQGIAEDDYYLALAQPYRAANRELVELGELVRVKGYDSNTVTRLQPYVSTLPTLNASTPINVNFASAEVLAAVISIPLSEARGLVEQRRGNPFTSVEDFEKRGGIKVTTGNITVSSQFFRVTGHARLGQAQVTTHALLQRSSGWPSVIWQSVQ